LAYRFQKLGYQFNRDDIDELYSRFLQVADSKKEVEDKDLSDMAMNYQKSEISYH
jgi:2-isopropylmalate synthase